MRISRRQGRSSVVVLAAVLLLASALSASAWRLWPAADEAPAAANAETANADNHADSVGDAEPAPQPPCPLPTETLRSSSPAPATAATLRLHNGLGFPVQMLWVGFDGKERNMGLLMSDASTEHSSYIGHAWRAKPYIFVDGAVQPAPLVLEVVLSAPDQLVQIMPCGGNMPGVQGRIQPTVPAAWLAADQSQSWQPPALTVTASLRQHCRLDRLLSKVASPGFHVVCAVPADELERQGLPAEQQPLLAVFFDGLTGAQPSHVFRLPPDNLVASLADFNRLLNYKLGVSLREHRQPPALFSVDGFRMQSLEQFFAERVGAYIIGGQWIWPGVDVGHKVTLDSFEGHTITIETLSLIPKVFAIEAFLSDEECEMIVGRANSSFTNSDVVYKDADQGKPVESWRQSEYYFFNSEGHPMMKEVERRAQWATRLPLTHAEDAQVLRYKNKGFYSAHHDFFDPSAYANDAHTLQLIDNGNRNRMATLFFYLNDVPAGGATGFPRAGGLPQPHDFKDCTRGLAVRPKKGKATLFYSLYPSGDPDHYSLHGGCAVEEGTKFAANFWIWNAPFANPQYRSDGHREFVADQLKRLAAQAAHASTHDEL